jgi:hypothetical protein
LPIGIDAYEHAGAIRVRLVMRKRLAPEEAGYATAPGVGIHGFQTG